LFLYNLLNINNMTGQELKDKLAADGVILSDLAAALGYASDQRLHSALRAADVKTGLLESIAKALNKSVGYFYGESGQTNESLNAELIRLRAENDVLREVIGLKKKGNSAKAV
jgi:hypothetical protein